MYTFDTYVKLPIIFAVAKRDVIGAKQIYMDGIE